MNKMNTVLAVTFTILVGVLIVPDVFSSYRSPKNTVMVNLPSKATQTANIAPKAVMQATIEALEVIELTEDNSVVMGEAFNDQSVSKVMLELQAKADKSPGTTVYLVLNTPGGSVDAGLRLISFIKGLNLRVKTLTLFAASMGFMTAQNLDERLILDTGTLMSHRAKFGVSGEYDGEMVTRFKWMAASIERLETIASKRMGLSLPVYKDLIRDEYWVDGADAVRDHAADRQVLAKCGAGLKGTKVIEVPTMLGTFAVEVSKCPLIPGYISASAKDGKVVNEDARKYIETMFSNRKRFVNEYITTNEWMKFQK